MKEIGGTNFQKRKIREKIRKFKKKRGRQLRIEKGGTKEATSAFLFFFFFLFSLLTSNDQPLLLFVDWIYLRRTAEYTALIESSSP